jgi:hypothetical protein
VRAGGQAGRGDAGGRGEARMSDSSLTLELHNKAQAYVIRDRLTLPDALAQRQ